MTTSLRILALEPFYGGSHASFLDHLSDTSRHKWHLATLPARHWKWRMRAGAFELVRNLPHGLEPFDVVFASDFVDLAAFRGLEPACAKRAVHIAYFHENQITYPTRNDDERDEHYAVTNLMTVRAADETWFNSDWHRRDFLDGVQKWCRKMPGPSAEAWLEGRQEHFKVVYPGASLPVPRESRRPEPESPIRILWNHRWEYDKNPDDFVAAVEALEDHGVAYELILCGQRYERQPAALERVERDFAHRIRVSEDCADRQEYEQRLRESDVVVSTAIHEFFGMSIVEAAAAGVYPLLPRRLSYPELLPPETWAQHYYDSPTDLGRRLAAAAQNPEALDPAPLTRALQRFRWAERAAAFDEALEAAYAARRSSALRG